MGEEMEGNVSIYRIFDEFDGLNTVTYLIWLDTDFDH
jgi:hypothetical protein